MYCPKDNTRIFFKPLNQGAFAAHRYFVMNIRRFFILVVDIGYFDFFSHGISVLNVEPWGGGSVRLDSTYSNTNKGYICFWIGLWSLVSGFDETFESFYTRLEFFLFGLKVEVYIRVLPAEIDN